MHDRDSKTQSIFSRFSLLDFLKKDKEEEKQVHERLAVKCNLCAGYEDYACVRGCPVGAAMRIDPVKHFGGTDLHIGLESKKNQ
jgi:Fe-S-cluster-containing hydrogenase component 2